MLCFLKMPFSIKNTPKSYQSTFVHDAHKSYNDSIAGIVTTVIPQSSNPWDYSRPSTGSPVLQKEFLLEIQSLFSMLWTKPPSFFMYCDTPVVTHSWEVGKSTLIHGRRKNTKLNIYLTLMIALKILPGVR